MNSRNLIPSQRLIAKRKQQAIGRWIVINLSYLVVLIIAGSTYGIYCLEEGDHSIAPLPATQIQTSTRSLAALQQHATLLSEQLQSVSDVYALPDWSILLRALSQQLGDDVVLTTVDNVGTNTDRSSTDSPPSSFQLEGVSRSQQAVTQFVLRLEDLKFFSRVKVDQVASRSFRGRDGIGFVITCSIPGSVGGSR